VKKQNRPGLTRLLAVAGLSMAVAACATVMAGTSQDIRIVSDPAGAECRIQRGDVSLHVISSTPGAVNVPRSKADLSVTCSKAGMEDGTEAIPAFLQGGTVGNAIAGGLVGVAVDAASGANFNYPELTIVTLEPASFDSVTARDAYFATQRAQVIAAADAEVKRIMSTCRQSKTEFCAIEAKRVDDSRERALATLERKRLAAKTGAG
jgi:hypothetical protein